MDARTHRRYLDYRDSHAYFGGQTAAVSKEEFAVLDQELATLETKGETRDDEEEARFAELAKLLHRD